jgi:hypothetical protein
VETILLQNLRIYLALRAFEQGGIVIVLHVLWYRASDFLVLSEVPPLSVASNDKQGDAYDLF